MDDWAVQFVTEFPDGVILAPTNSDVAELLVPIMAHFTSTMNNSLFKTYVASDVPRDMSTTKDQGEEDERDANVPWEEDILRNLRFGGLPPHSLEVFEGMTVMCVRNICPRCGAVNGQRYTIRTLRTHTIVCDQIRPECAETYTFTRVPMEFEDGGKNPLRFVRTQFPLIPASVITQAKVRRSPWTLLVCSHRVSRSCMGNNMLH